MAVKNTGWWFPTSTQWDGTLAAVLQIEQKSEELAEECLGRL